MSCGLQIGPANSETVIVVLCTSWGSAGSDNHSHQWSSAFAPALPPLYTAERDTHHLNSLLAGATNYEATASAAHTSALLRPVPRRPPQCHIRALRECVFNASKLRAAGKSAFYSCTSSQEPDVEGVGKRQSRYEGG